MAEYKTLPIAHTDKDLIAKQFLNDWLDEASHNYFARTGYADNISKPKLHINKPGATDLNYDICDFSVGMPNLNWSYLPNKWVTNSIWIPSGASRCTYALLFLVDKLNLDDYFEFRLLNDSEPILLKPILQYKLNNNDFYLTLLSDRRFWDREKLVDLEGIETWSQIFYKLPFYNDIDGFAEIPKNHYPAWPLWQRHVPAGFVLDWLAACLNCRIVFDPFKNKYKFKTPEQSISDLDNRSTENIIKLFEETNSAKIEKVSISLPFINLIEGTETFSRAASREIIQKGTSEDTTGRHVTVYTSHPIVYHTGIVLNQAETDIITESISKYFENWVNTEKNSLFSYPPIQIPDMTGFDDYIWIRLDDQNDLGEYHPKVLVKSLGFDIFPTDFPIWFEPIGPESSSSESSVSESSISESSISESSISESISESSISESSISESSVSESSISESSISESSVSESVSESSISKSESISESKPSESAPSEQGSDKSSAIVPASWQSTGYTALFIHEMPEVRFDDILTIIIPQLDSEFVIDPRFVEVCEKGTLSLCGVVPNKPVLLGADVIDGNKIKILFSNIDEKNLIKLVIRLTGIRRGFRGKRFPARTKEQFIANEKFINSAYPAS